MTVPAGTPGDEVPAEDWAEQAADAGSVADAEPPLAGRVVGTTVEANEADLAEQGLTVDFDDDDR